MNKNKMILASGSPRRKLLLKRAGYSFRVEASNINEDIEIKDPHSFTKTLSERKAKALLSKYPEYIIIAADTMVFMDNRLYGKPSDFKQAIKMMNDFSDNTHKIVTGITILSNDKKIIDSDEAEIKLNKLSEEQIVEFLNRTNPYDKAGGYSVEELPKEFIQEVKGDMTTILGLPMQIVEKHLVNLT